MVVDWPEGHEELVFTTNLPAHAVVDDVPAHVRAHAEERSEVVCYYDDVHCRTCFCDGRGGCGALECADQGGVTHVNTREQFFADDAVVAALDEYGNIALDHLEDAGIDADLPDLMAFLRQRGVPEPPGGSIPVELRLGEPEFSPEMKKCPDGSDPQTVCVEVNGKSYCRKFCA